MKNFLLLSIIASTIALNYNKSFAQDIAINIATQELSVSLGDTGTILVQITNNSFTTDCEVQKLRPLVTIPPNIAVIPTNPSSQSGFGSNVDNWAILVNNGSDFRVTNSQIIPPLTSSTYFIKYVGIAVAPTSTFSATLFFNGPQTSGNNTQNDVSNSSITVTSPVPLKLTSFTTQEKSCNKVDVKWRTAYEENLSHFDVEYSNDSKTFKTIANIKSKNAALGSEYIVTVPQNDIQGFYRLKFVDQDNTFSYSDVNKVKLECASSAISLTPNPTTGIVHVNNMEGSETIFVYNVTGQKLMEQNAASGKNQLNISHLPAGMYNFVIMESNKMKVSFKVVKQ